jgi:hypothetical protein
MEWLLRYALHCGVRIFHRKDPCAALRKRFAAPTWRLIWRSGRDAFLPILRNRRLGFGDLIAYVDKLVAMGFTVAPAAHLVQHVVDQSYLYLDESPDAPVAKRDLTLIRVAQRSGPVSRREFALVLEWVVRTRPRIHDRRVWFRLVREAAAWRKRVQIELAQATDAPWSFALNEIDIGSYRFVALKTSTDLWVDGVEMGHCLYALRSCCKAPRPSRFFSVRRGDRVVGTAELQPLNGHSGWFLRDVRRSFNRLPDPGLLAAAEQLAEAYEAAAGRWQEAA